MFLLITKMIINYNGLTKKNQISIHFKQGSIFDINNIYIIVRRRIIYLLIIICKPTNNEPFPSLDVHNNFPARFYPQILPPLKIQIGVHLIWAWAPPTRTPLHPRHCVGPRLLKVAGGQDAEGRQRLGGRQAATWHILTHFPQICINLYVNEARRHKSGRKSRLDLANFIRRERAPTDFTAV